MPGLKRRSSSKGRKPFLNSLVSGQTRRTEAKERVQFIYVDQSLGLPWKMNNNNNELPAGKPEAQSNQRDDISINSNHNSASMKELNITSDPNLTTDKGTENEINDSLNDTIDSDVIKVNLNYSDDCGSNASRSRNTSGNSVTSVNASEPGLRTIVQLPVVNTQLDNDLNSYAKQTFDGILQEVQMRDKKGRAHRVEADVHSKCSSRESWFEAEVFDINKMNISGISRNSDVFEKSPFIEETSFKSSSFSKSDKKKDNVKVMKQKRKLLRRLLKYQSTKHSEAVEDIKTRAELLVENIKQKEAAMLENLQTQYELTAFEILGQIEALDEQLYVAVSKTSKRNSLVQELIEKESLNDSSGPDDVSSLISEPLTDDVILKEINENSNTVPQVGQKAEKVHSKVRVSAVLDDNVMISQKFVPGPSYINFGAVDFPKVTSDVLRKSKHKKQRRNAAGSSVSSDPRKSWLLDPQLSICQESTCRVSWMLDRTSRHKGPLLNVEGLAFTQEGELVVAEHTVDKGRLQVFDKKGASKCMIGEGSLLPWNVSIWKNGDYLVPSRKTKSLSTVTIDGQLINDWEENMFVHPTSVACNADESKFYVVDTDSSKVTIHKPNGECIGKLRATSDQENLMGQPVSVTAYQDYVAVLDKTNHCIHLFDSSGAYLYNFGKNGNKDGCLKHPSSLTVDNTGHIYVADSHNNRVSKFTIQGVFVEHVATEDDAVMDPTCVAVSSETGQLAVADMFGLKVFNINS